VLFPCFPAIAVFNFCHMNTAWTRFSCAEFEVPMAASMKMAVFWVVVPCSLVEVYWHFRGNRHLWNIGKLPPDYSVLQPSRQPSSRFSCVCLWCHIVHRVLVHLAISSVRTCGRAVWSEETGGASGDPKLLFGWSGGNSILYSVVHAAFAAASLASFLLGPIIKHSCN
jgi:hypothetical protein